MKIARIPASDIDLSQPLTHDGQMKAFERRLVRLWQIGILPSRITKALGISLKQFSDELDRLDKELKGISVETKTILEIGASAGGAASRKTKEQLRLLDLDLVWLFSLDGIITRKEMAAFLGVQEHALTHHQRRIGKKVNTDTDEDRNQRNSQIISDYLEAVREGKEWGIVSRLSKRYNLSRKMIDLILADNKIASKPKPKKEDPEMIEKHNAICKAWSERLPNAASENALSQELAMEFGYKSQAGILKIVKKLKQNSG